jgi:hypothetical protein
VRTACAAILACLVLLAPAPGTAHPLGDRACAAIAGRVDAVPGDGPVFLRSFDDAAGDGPPAEPALRTAAFAYDNALAAVALVACGRLPQAARVGGALLAAALHDRAGERGRLRNAYRAGPADERPVPPAGWWDEASGRWLEDAYQVGTATGNVAWAALALLTLGEATGDGRWADGAEALAGWAVRRTADPRGPGGFAGGLFGHDDRPLPLSWKSTEHNADLAAVFAWLDRAGAQGDWSARAAEARRFLDAMWAAGGDRFPTGTLPDGAAVNRATSGLDAQLWPLLLRDAPDAWRAALAYAERAHGVPGGFDFDADRDGLWVEGTAQAALVLRVVGRADEGRALLAGISGEASPGGLLWATRQPSITTGLAIGPDSATDDFRYFRMPHLAPTAWAVLAAEGWNPFTGRRLPLRRPRRGGGPSARPSAPAPGSAAGRCAPGRPRPRGRRSSRGR